jgi:hypothetical protein
MLMIAPVWITFTTPSIVTSSSRPLSRWVVLSRWCVRVPFELFCSVITLRSTIRGNQTGLLTQNGPDWRLSRCHRAHLVLVNGGYTYRVSRTIDILGTAIVIPIVRSNHGCAERIFGISSGMNLLVDFNFSDFPVFLKICHWSEILVRSLMGC